MADEIRQALARLAEPVVPRPDPYERLLLRVRRRRRRRMAMAGVVGLMMAATALPSFGAVDRLTTADEPSPATAEYQPASPIDEPMVQRLLDSPTRGNLAGDPTLVASIEREYRAARARLLVDPALNEVRVLLAHEVPGARTVVVAFLGGSHALLRAGSGRAGASVPELLDQTGTPDEPQPLVPYVSFGRHSLVDGHGTDLAVGLAPAGCRVDTSVGGRLQPDGSVVRSWQPASTDGFVVRGAGETGERWRFTCDGVVRYAGPAAGGAMVRAIGPTPARSAVDLRMFTASSAVQELQGMLDRNGLTGPSPRVIWTGRLPDWVSGAPTASLAISCSADGGCAALLKTDAVRLLRTDSGTLIDYRTGIGTFDLVAVPLPGEAAGVLVSGPESAVRAELVDAGGTTVAEGPLTDGVGVFEIDHRKVSRVTIFDSEDSALRTGATPHLTADVHDLGEPTVWAW
ncbi:hypothetical protein [Micromonospora sp. WMMD1082]|uniref:hypothetical protein n=1 Tax=Micromonospora sp. WMMD1082 TaxID=3016104 RepID=UPI0024166EE8|nr:hypothetical protein [Micromonospora sp. WMMD1082]MDG4798832.1 hypothetical protein [Micromonospora sp. WMMD1082]